MGADDTVKSQRKYKTMIDCAQKLYAEGGIARFYKGFTPCILRSVPANGAAYGLWFVTVNKLLKDY